MVELNVNGKVAVITGGSRGLGLDCAEILALNGASTIVITSRKAPACEEAKAHIEKVAKAAGKNVKVISIPADLAVEKDCARFFEETAKQVDKVDILIANAGATWGAPLDTHPVSAVKKVLELNVAAVFHTIQLFTPLLEKAGSAEDPSRILIMSSVASIVPSDAAGTYGYLASKAGVSHMGKTLALHLGPRNINVNSLAPGFFPSKMTKGLLEVAGDFMRESNPKGRLGRKEDLQSVVLFLSAKESGYLNGIVVPVDGGAHLGFAKL